MYQERPTQEQRILKLLKQRGKNGAFVWEFMLPRNRGGLGIAQYNARIWSLRKKGFNIINTTPGHFIFEEYKEEKNGQFKLI